MRLTSRGPVLFGQERVGLGGEHFTMYKFRTMHRDAEALLQRDPALWNDYVANGYKVPAELDRRITPLGRFLRRSSLDELPQILNVLTGEMSLVGPRPVVPDEVDNYGEQQQVYLSVRPGITGAWQVNGRSTIDYPDRVDIDAEYVRRWSVWLDIKILVKTPIVVLSTAARSDPRRPTAGAPLRALPRPEAAGEPARRQDAELAPEDRSSARAARTLAIRLSGTCSWHLRRTTSRSSASKSYGSAQGWHSSR